MQYQRIKPPVMKRKEKKRERERGRERGRGREKGKKKKERKRGRERGREKKSLNLTLQKLNLQMIHRWVQYSSQVELYIEHIQPSAASGDGCEGERDGEKEAGAVNEGAGPSRDGVAGAEEEEEETDLKLAWEVLELARVICQK